MLHVIDDRGPGEPGDPHDLQHRTLGLPRPIITQPARASRASAGDRPHRLVRRRLQLRLPRGHRERDRHRRPARPGRPEVRTPATSRRDEAKGGLVTHDVQFDAAGPRAGRGRRRRRGLRRDRTRCTPTLVYRTDEPGDSRYDETFGDRRRLDRQRLHPPQLDADEEQRHRGAAGTTRRRTRTSSRSPRRTTTGRPARARARSRRGRSAANDARAARPLGRRGATRRASRCARRTTSTSAAGSWPRAGTSRGRASSTSPTRPTSARSATGSRRRT